MSLEQLLEKRNATEYSFPEAITGIFNKIVSQNSTHCPQCDCDCNCRCDCFDD